MFAGLLGTAAVDSQAIIFVTLELLYCVPGGLGTMTTSIVGNHLGACQWEEVRRVCTVSLGVTLVIETGIALLLYLFGSPYIRLYTDDSLVLSITMDALPWLTVFVIGDGLQQIGSSILKGAGQQFIGAWINFIAFYAVGLPLSWHVCFYWGYGVTGLIIGLGCANWLQVGCHLILVYRCEQLVFGSMGREPIQEGEGGGVELRNTGGWMGSTLPLLGFGRPRLPSYQSVNDNNIYRNTSENFV